MNAPVIWILFPLLGGIFTLLALRERSSALVGGSIAAALSFLALIFPIDTALLFGSISIKIASSIQFFGRSFVLNTADGPLLCIIYGLAALWFFGAQASATAHRFISLGLMIVSLLTASIAVEPFLYAALLLEMAAMLVIPLLIPLDQRPGRGVIRFLIFQTLAMPFILFSGWMLAGVEASPGDISLTTQAGTMLGLGFAFLLAIFPLYSWVPMLTEETIPYATGFLLWTLSTFTVIFALGFLDRYAWLRASSQLSNAIQISGVLMTASAGLLASTQKHIGRMMGYASIAEAGLIILAMGLKSSQALNITFLFLIPRGLELAVWSLGLSILKREGFSLRFGDMKGLSRKYPITTAAIILAHLSVTGFPILAGFPPRLALWQELASQSLFTSFWIFLGMLGLLVGAIRTLAIFVMAEEGTGWSLNETRTQAGLLGTGVIGLFILGLFPQIMQPFLYQLPAIFEHLGG